MILYGPLTLHSCSVHSTMAAEKETDLWVKVCYCKSGVCSKCQWVYICSDIHLLCMSVPSVSDCDAAEM